MGPLANLAVAVLLVLDISHKRVYDYDISFKAPNKKRYKRGNYSL